MTDFVDPFEALEAKPELKVVSAVRPVLTHQEYVDREVEITHRQYERYYESPKPGDTTTLESRLSRSRAYCEWRWEQYHTTLNGTRLEDGDFKHDPHDRQVASL